jgi:hypothetical protein
MIPMVRSFEAFLAEGEGVAEAVVDAAIDAGRPEDVGAADLHLRHDRAAPKGR